MSTSTLKELPAIGQPLAGGVFAGLTTLPDGTHVAVALLPDQASNISWADSKAWATSVGGVLPTRSIASLLYATVKPIPKPSWHWTSDEHEYNASFAWYCYFFLGFQNFRHKSFEGSAVAVRCIPLSS